MTRLLLLLALAALVLPGAARPAACSPLDCAPSQFTLAGGTLLAVRGSVDGPVRVIDLRSGATRFRLPAGVVAGDTLVSRSGALLTWYDLATGARLRDAALQLHGTFRLVGASRDGRRAVLARTQRLSTTFAVVSPRGSRTVNLAGNVWGFDALAGDRLVLIHYLARGYEIRLFDLASNRLRRTPLRDPHDAALIWGAAFARASSPDGRYLFTLYIGPNGGSMIHVLDLQNATARCVELPGTGNFNAAMTTALAVSRDGRTLWAASPGYGRLTAIDVASRRVRAAFRFPARDWLSNPGTAVLSPDGRRLAVSDAQHLWILRLADGYVVSERRHVAIAVGWSPSGDRLWVVGERSRVSSLPG